MGLRGMPSCDLIFEDVRVPKEMVVIGQGDFKNLMTTFDIERCGQLGPCAWAWPRARTEAARDYAMQREAFGRPICEFQARPVPGRGHGHADRPRRGCWSYRAATGAGQGLPSIYEAFNGKMALPTKWSRT